MMNFFRPFTPLLQGWVLSFVGWGLVALVLGINFVGGTDLPWTRALRAAIRDQLPWAILTPMLFRFAWRYPIDRSHWKRVGVHLLVFLAIVCGLHFWKDRIDPGPGPHRPPGDPGRRGFGQREHGRHPPDLARRHDAAPSADRGGPPAPPGHYRGREGRMGRRGPPPPAWDFFHFSSVEIPIYLMIISGAHTLLFYRRDQERAASLARARLDSLKMQLQPHFLFNTLNTISGLIHEDPNKADTLLTALSDLLRQSLESSDKQLTTLEHELEFTQSYLAIMKARYEERLNYRLEIEPGTRGGMVPPHILQPLVENAVCHGLEPTARGGTVTVKAWTESGKLHLCVEDDGSGLTSHEPIREGVGLSNTRARLTELFGDEASLKLSNGSGVTVEIALPFRTTA